MIPYHWQYLPLLMQILFAIGLARGHVAGVLVRRAAPQLDVKLAAYECGIEAVGDARAPLQRPLLHGRDAVHPLRRGSGLHDALGGHLPPASRTSLASDCSASGRWWFIWGFVAVGLYYIVRKGILNWSQDKADL